MKLKQISRIVSSLAKYKENVLFEDKLIQEIIADLHEYSLDI